MLCGVLEWAREPEAGGFVFSSDVRGTEVRGEEVSGSFENQPMETILKVSENAKDRTDWGHSEKAEANPLKSL